MNNSTEGELVSTHDQMPDILHTLYFIEAQGYTIDKNIIYYDNQSTIRLEVNGRIISGKKTNHISSIFFFATDKIAKGEVDVDYFPTEKIWCDIINNPNQGAPYRLNRSHLMNVPVGYDDEVYHKATHPVLLETKQYNKIEVPPCNRNIYKANPSLVCRSVLENGIKEVRWDLERVPQRNRFWGSARDITNGNIPVQGRVSSHG